MIQGHVTFRDGDQACQTALTGQEVIVTVESHRIADGVTDSKQSALAIEQKAHVDFRSQLVGLGCEPLQSSHHLCSVLLRLPELALCGREPVRNFRANVLGSAPSEQRGKSGVRTTG